jgi:hypothetical protein
MVATLRSVLLAAIFAWLAICTLPAKELADYRLGDAIEADIVAPEKFIVVDVAATETLRRREAQQRPMVARYYPGVAGEVETALRREFANARNNFLNAVETQFHRRMPDAAITDDFLQSVVQSPGLDKSFPLTTGLAGIWARGESDGKFLAALAGHLHEAMKQFIFPAQPPEGWHTGNAARLVALTNYDAVPTPELVEGKSFTVVRSNIVSFTRARTEFRNAFPPEDRAWANFVLQFLKENCAPDMKLTEAVSARRTASIQMGDTYQAGQVIGRRGDVVNAKILAAIGRLREIPDKLRPQTPAVTPVKAVPVVVLAENNHWLWFALGAISLVAVAAVWKLRRRPVVTLLPARLDSTQADATLVPAPTGSVDLRQLLAPHLARLLMNKFVRRLISQRAELMVTQEKVAAEIAELEARLEAIHAPLQDRLAAYEKRIAELEKQLSARDEQNRELIKAKIEVIKKQLETERAKSRMLFN